MHQFEWLNERLAHDDLDETIILTYSRVGTWIGLRVREFFQLTGDGSFMWEWEDEYLHILYQKQRCILDKRTTSWLFQLFQDGLPSLLPFHQEQSLPPLLPDSLPAHFSITVGDHQASYWYLPDQQHRSSGQMGAAELEHLLEEFARLRKQQGDDAVPPTSGEKI